MSEHPGDAIERRRRQREERRDFVFSAVVVTVCLVFVLGMAALVIHLLNRDREAEVARNRPPPVIRTGQFVVPKGPPPEFRPASPADPGPPAAPNTRGSLDTHPKLPPVRTPEPDPTNLESPPYTAPAVPPPAASTPDEAFPRSELRPDKPAIPGYFARKIHGFNVLVSRMAYDQSDELDRRPLGYLETEFARIAELLPPDKLKALARVMIWVEWDHTIPEDIRTYGVYYGGAGEGLYAKGVDPRKARSVCLLSLKTAYKLRAEGKSKKLVILHELAHAVHDQYIGLKNPVVANAYDQAMARRLYDKVRHIDLTEREGYAATNEAEYFAELTCAYLDRLDYTPTNRDELKEHDSVGYELMMKTWGTPEQIEARRKKMVKPLR